MKKLNRTLLSVVLVLCLMLSLAAVASASTVEFTGKESGFDFQPEDLFENLKNVMPGDCLTQTVTFTNSADDCAYVNLTMSSRPSEDGNMQDFLEQLHMTVKNGDNVIYDGTAAMTLEGVALGTYRQGETAALTVELEVPMDLGNEYAYREGDVEWTFHVESFLEGSLTVKKVWKGGQQDSAAVNLLQDGKVVETVTLSSANDWTHTFTGLVETSEWTVEEAKVPTGYTVSYKTEGDVVTITNTAITETPATGDNTPLMLLLALLVGSAVIGTGAVMYLRKKNG